MHLVVNPNVFLPGHCILISIPLEVERLLQCLPVSSEGCDVSAKFHNLDC